MYTLLIHSTTHEWFSTSIPLPSWKCSTTFDGLLLGALWHWTKRDEDPEAITNIMMGGLGWDLDHRHSTCTPGQYTRSIFVTDFQDGDYYHVARVMIWSEIVSVQVYNQAVNKVWHIDCAEVGGGGGNRSLSR